MKKVLVIGGQGNLGKSLIQKFKKNWITISLDVYANKEAKENILLKDNVSEELKKILQNEKLDSILNVAGGWKGGNLKSKDFEESVELMYNQSVKSSILAAKLSTLYLKDNSLLLLTGSKSCLQPTPGMIGYGLAKNSVHYLVNCLKDKNSGLPNGTRVIGILPTTLDTPDNRKFNPGADYSTWTNLEQLSNQIYEWSEHPNQIQSGLIEIETKNNETKYHLL